MLPPKSSDTTSQTSNTMSYPFSVANYSTTSGSTSYSSSYPGTILVGTKDGDSSKLAIKIGNLPSDWKILEIGYYELSLTFRYPTSNEEITLPLVGNESVEGGTSTYTQIDTKT